MRFKTLMLAAAVAAALPLTAQEDEVGGAAWFPIEALAPISARGLRRIRRFQADGVSLSSSS